MSKKSPLRKPNLFIVGAGRSGTTALHEFLSQHPDIFMSDPKEPRFFCKDLIRGSDSLLKRTRRDKSENKFYFPIRSEKQYSKIFSAWKNEKIAGEASPQYLISKVAAREICKFNPNAKIIILIRNPVDWMYSYYLHALYSAAETITDFKTALSLEVKRKGGKHLPKSPRFVQPSRVFYAENAHFSGQLERFYDVFDRKQIKVIIFEDFRENNEGTYREVLNFLGVDPTFRAVFSEVSATKNLRLGNLYILFKSLKFSKLLSIPKRFLPPRWGGFYEKTMRRIRGKIFQKGYPPMDPGLRLELIKKFKLEVKKLSELTNRDLVSLWGYDKI